MDLEGTGEKHQRQCRPPKSEPIISPPRDRQRQREADEREMHGDEQAAGLEQRRKLVHRTGSAPGRRSEDRVTCTSPLPFTDT
jgi:hypothetical protein